MAPTDIRIAYKTKSEILEDIQLARNANMNMIRVHAHVDREPEFHDACDEIGVLVWQDLPFQWSYSKKVLEPAKNQASQAVKLP